MKKVMKKLIKKKKKRARKNVHSLKKILKSDKY